MPSEPPATSSNAAMGARRPALISWGAAIRGGRQPGNGAFCPVVCGDPGIKGKQDLAGMAPKDCFIPAKPVERVVGQIGQTREAMCEVGGGSNGFRPRAGPGFRSVCDAVGCSIGIGIGGINPPEPCIDNFLRLCLSLAALPELTQIGSLDVEQAGLDCRGAAQS